MILSPAFWAAATILALLQANPASARYLCSCRSRGDTGCKVDEPYFCCSNIQQGECCQTPAHDWCGCMEGRNLLHETGVGHDAIMFYQRNDGKSLIDETEYFTREPDDIITSNPFEKKLEQCSIRVVTSYKERFPKHRLGISGGRTSRPNVRSPNGPPSKQCRDPNIVRYKLPSGQLTASVVSREHYGQVMKLMSDGGTDLIDGLRLNEELRGQRGHPDAQSDSGSGSEDDFAEVSDAGSSYGSEDVK